MTKCYLFVFLFFSSFAINAQIKKQSILLGGQLFYYNNKSQVENLNQKSESGTISISIGKAFKDNNILGINLSFSPIRQSNYLNNGDTTSLAFNRFDIGMFYREYKKLAKDFYFFSQVDASYVTANQTEHYKIASADVKATQRGGFISLTPGISYQVFKKMQLEVTIPNILSIQYLVTKFENEVTQVKNSKQEQFLFYSNINNNTGLGFLGVGFRFIL
ncbi:MAG: hypothetical protein J0I09_00120 [Sphingobacteriia bacterium]|nr:hypothetical protein [Sphingobacteriia bacterium]